MRVRIYDEKRDVCFLSELYAVLYTGIFARCLAVFEGRLHLYHQLLPQEDGAYRTMVSMVDPEEPAEWIRRTNGDLDDFPDFPKALPEDRWIAFRGYPWVWEDRDTLLRLLAGEDVPLSETDYPAVSSLLPGWNYVADEAGAQAFLEEMGYFHDAVLVQAHYVSGSGKVPGGGICVMDYVRQVTLLFHNYDMPPIELVFEGVKAFHLRPGGNNYVSDISEAVCRVRNAMVFFCCGDCEEGKEADCTDTCIWAYSMRWRFLPETPPLDE